MRRLRDLIDELRWQWQFFRTRDVLAALAKDIEAEYRAGRTRRLP